MTVSFMQVMQVGPWLAVALLAPLIFCPLALISRRSAPVIALILQSISLGVTLSILPFIATGNIVEVNAGKWLDLGPLGLTSYIAFRIDVLSWLMLFIITFVGLLIFIYSLGYMEHDPYVKRFWLFMLMFSGSMIGVVSSNDMFLLFLFWELTTLSSFALIGHWIDRESALYGSIKALMLTGFGGLVMAIGLYVLMIATHTPLISVALSRLSTAPPTLVSIAAALILIGVMAKSAQFPFFTWLPDAMEAPTPVSAFLHSAAMVKAGVYIYARFIPLFAQNLYVACGALVIFAVTAMIGAMYATIESNAKRVLAYSTVSQLGYMLSAFALSSIFLGISRMVTGSLESFMILLSGFAMLAGMLHLLNHAIFKAALFLATGAVEHEAGTKDLDEMGGFIRHMPLLAAGFTICVLGLVGVPLFNGFVSKWMIYQSLIGALIRNTSITLLLLISLAILLFGTALTAAYGIRMIYGIFFGISPRRDIHVSEPPYVMLVPILILAVGVIFLGVWPNIALELFHMLPPPYTVSTVPALNFLIIPMLFGTKTSLSMVYTAILFSIAILIGLFGFLGKAKIRTVPEPFIGGESLDIVIEHGVPKAKIRSESFFLEVKEVFATVRRRLNPDAAYHAIAKAFDGVSKGLRYLEAGHVILYLGLIIIGVIIMLAFL